MIPELLDGIIAITLIRPISNPGRIVAEPLTAAETANTTKVLVFTTGEGDLTDAVLTQLNSAAPAGWDKDLAKPAADAKPVAPLPSTDKDGKK